MRYNLLSPDGREIGYISDSPEFKWALEKDYPYRKRIMRGIKRSAEYEMVVAGGEDVAEDAVTPPEEDVPIDDTGRVIRLASELPGEVPVQVEKADDMDKTHISQELTHLVDKAIGKERIYVDDPSEVPEGVEPQEGEQGGTYYETDQVHQGGGEEAPWSTATFEEMGEVLIPVVGEEEVERLAGAMPEGGTVDDAVAMMESMMENSNRYEPEDRHELYVNLGDAFGSPLSDGEGGEEEGEGDGSDDEEGAEEETESPVDVHDGLSIDDAVELVAGVAGEKAAYALFGDMQAPDSGEAPNPESYVTQAANNLPREAQSQLQDLLEGHKEEQQVTEERAEEHASEVPDTAEEALERIEESLKDEVDDLDTAMENWESIVNGEVDALEGVDEERRDAVEQGLQQLKENKDFNSLLESHDINPAVIVADPEKLNQNVGYDQFHEGAEAERKAGVTWMHDTPLTTRQVEAEKPEPGEYVSSGDVGSVLRHEMTHDLWDEMDNEFKQWFQFEATPDDEEIAEGLTEYATGRPEETFTELIATTTNPKYDPDDFPDWVNELAEDVKARVRGEKETEFNIDDLKESSMGNERRESVIKVEDLKKPEINIEKNSLLRKVGENFIQVDDMLMEAFEKQIWQDDLTKAPDMWRRDDEVPQFVRSHLKDAIDKTDALHGEFSNIPHAAALKVHEIIKDQLTDPQGWSIETVTKALADEFDQLAVDKAEDIARTEIAAVLNKAREIAYDAAKAAQAANAARNITGLPDGDQPADMEVGYYWAGPEDHATTKICSETKSEIESRGGFVSKDELKEILYTKAKEHEKEDGGLPNRVDSFVPHYQCRHTFIREDYQRVT